MSLEIRLPQVDGTLQPYTLGLPSTFHPPTTPLKKRIPFAAVHIVCDPLADINPTLETAIDWEATLAYRHHIWRLGLAVAEAMDTAQRGMGLNWESAQELIRRSVGEARAVGGQIACGAGTDHLAPHPEVSVNEVLSAYEEQVSFVEGVGGRVILMASRALAACAAGPDDYIQVYSRILEQVSQPVIIHWLGEMFDPALVDYWGSNNMDTAMDVCLQIIRQYANKVDGIKVSLLDDQREIEMRRRLPAGVRMYSGDDFNFPQLILGDEQGYSDALLGIFDAIAPAASAAMQALDAGNMEQYRSIFAPTVPLSRHIFKAPTYYYKTGVVFMAYLNGHQSHFKVVGGYESARSIIHLSELFRLADKAGLLGNPELAVARMGAVLSLAGVN